MTNNAALRGTALHHLAADASVNKLWPKAVQYYGQLVQSPTATVAEAIEYLTLLRRGGSPEYFNFLDGLKQKSIKSPVHAFSLGRWIAMVDGSSNALPWLKSLPLAIQTNQPVPLIITDCQIDAKDWPALQSFVAKADWGEAEYYRLAVEALAKRSLGQDAPSTAAWRKAVRQSEHRLDRLQTLVRASGVWHWTNEETEVLRQVSAEFPKEKWASELLIAQLYSAGDTRGLQDILSKLSAADPNDARL
jgi:hypothetical protein